MSTITDQLPMAEMQYPTCGACSGETYHDGDSLRCDDCKLRFDSSSLEAEYNNEDDEACGASCGNFWHGPGRIRDEYAYDCGTCILPVDHSSAHHTDCKPRKIES